MYIHYKFSVIAKGKAAVHWSRINRHAYAVYFHGLSSQLTFFFTGFYFYVNKSHYVFSTF